MSSTDFSGNGTTKKGVIPKFKPVDQNYARKKTFYTKEEWLNIHEMDISDTYDALNRYLIEKNLPFLDNCSYVDFCDFVGDKSSRRRDYND